MSQQTLTVSLVAKDGISTVFQKIGQSGQTAAAQITASGRTASAGLAQMDANATKAATSTTKLGSAASGAAKGISAIHAAASGAAFATFLGFLSDASNAAAEDEADFTRLETAVTATGAAYGTYANSLDKAITGAQRLAFSDDAAADALATLVSQTQDTARAQQLLAVSMDLARGKGISLGAAASIIGKVAEGNTAILTRYGITIDQNATSTEALAAVQQRFAGQAQAFSNSQGGAIARVQENLDNFVESIGGALGPMQTWLALLPGVSSGMSLAGGAAGALSKALFGVAEAEDAVAAAGAASSAGGLAGLAVVGTLAAPVALTAAAFGVLIKSVQDYTAAADAAADPTDTLRIAIARLQEAGQDTSLPQQISDAWGEASKSIGDYAEAQANVIAQQQATTDVDLRAQLEDQAKAARDVNLTVEERAQLEQDLDAILANGNSNRQQALDATLALLQGYDGINSTAPGVAAGIHTIADNLDTYGITISTATDNTDAFVASLEQPGIHAGLSAATTDLINFGDAAEAQTARVAAAFEHMPAIPSGAGFGAGLHGAEFDTNETRQAATDLRTAREDAANAAEDAARAAQDHAQALQDERDAALDTANTLIGSQDEQLAQTQQLADAQEQYASRVGDINSGLADQLTNLEESYGKTVADIQDQRVQGEQDAADAMKQINQDRADVTIKAEQDIADVAAQRQQVMADAERQSQDAARQFAEQQQQTVEAQAAVRDKLNETTQAAADKWHEAVQQNVEQQRQIRSDLAAAIADVERAFSESTAQAQQDLQRLAEDHRIALAGFATDEKRIKQDLQTVLNDPRATAEQKNAAELQARRQLHDLDDQRDAESLANARKKQDIQEQQQQAAEDAARKEKDLRAQAAQQQQQADEARAQAQQQYQDAVSQANQQAQQQLASIAEQQQSAADDYQRKREDIAQQESEALDGLAQKEQDIIDARAKSYADLAEKRRTVQEDLAKKEDDLNKQVADAAANYNESVYKAQSAAADQRASAQEQYAKATKTDLTELQRLRDDGLITEGQYKDAYDELTHIQDTSKKIEDAKLVLAIKQLPHQQDLLDIELKRLDAQQKMAELPDPLDGTPATGATPTKSTPTATLAADKTPFMDTLNDAIAMGDEFSTQTFTATIAGTASLGGSGGMAQIGSGVQPFDAAVVAAQGVGDDWSRKVYTASVAGDDAAFRAEIADADAYGQGWARAGGYTAQIMGDGDQFGAAIADADKAGTNFQNGSAYTASLAGDFTAFAQDVAAARGIGQSFENTSFDAKLGGDRKPFDDVIEALREEYDQKHFATTYIDIVARMKDTAEKADPLDGPPPKGTQNTARVLGGFGHGRTLIGEAGSELAIRGNRMWEVGAGGAQWLDLASGTLIMPHGAAQARMRAAGMALGGMALGGHMADSVPQAPTARTGRASGASIINNYGTITIKVDNADIGAEIARQMGSRDR